MKRVILTATLSLLLTGICLGDQLDVGGAKYNGTFDAYDNSFHFTTGSGKKRTEKPARVKALSFEEPVEVTFKVLNDRKEYKALLKGYEYSNFLIEIEGKDVSVHSSVVLSMTPHQEKAPPPPRPPPPEKKPEVPETIEDSPPPTKPRSVEIPREARDSQRYPIPKVDTKSIASRDLSQEQRLTLESFVAAKAGYDAFMRSSSAMVAQLDSATGSKRAKLLAELRARKNNEQPLKDALLKAHQKLEGEL